MNKGVNKVILLGNLGKDPEVRYTADGKAVTTVSLATSETWKDKNTGEMREKTEWHRIVMFGRLAEIAGEYLTKGSKVYFEGKMQTRKWQDQSGQDRYTTEIVLDPYNGVMQMLDTPSRNDQAQQQPNENKQSHENEQAQQTSPTVQDDFNDDIPF